MLDSTDANDAHDPRENAEHADPTEPIDANDPMEPIENDDPVDAIEQNELRDQSESPGRGMSLTQCVGGELGGGTAGRRGPGSAVTRTGRTARASGSTGRSSPTPAS